MKFGLFVELQMPRPWEKDAEHQLFKNVLDQVELADRLGFDHVWVVEHHFLEEYSHSTAPEVILGALSQRTKNIRLGHGIVAMPPAYNPTARIAERIATLDLISDGRVDFGTGETSSAVELGGFNIPRASKTEQWRESVDAVTRMMVEEPFAGYDGEYLKMEPRNVVPKVLQEPHPPLWLACSKRASIMRAAQNGMGAIANAFVDPHEAGKWVQAYYDVIESEECVPAGFAVNPNLALAIMFGCHEDEATAIARHEEGSHFFVYSLGHYYGFGDHRPAGTNLWDEFQQNREQMGLIPTSAHGLDPDAAQAKNYSGCIGTPAQIRETIRAYEQVGLDELIMVAQNGKTKHEHIMESLELFGTQVLPEFKDREPERERAKLERLAPAMERALKRRDPARDLPLDYSVSALGDVPES